MGGGGWGSENITNKQVSERREEGGAGYVVVFSLYLYDLTTYNKGKLTAETHTADNSDFWPKFIKMFVPVVSLQ